MKVSGGTYTKGGIIAAGIVFVFLGYILFTRQSVPVASNEIAVPQTLLPPRTPPAGFQEYRNTTYRFSLFYPSGMKVTEFDEGDGARTITFENVAGVKGFQIFIVPYGAQQVSVERFRKDVPSGMREQSTDLLIDGSVANAFFSNNIALGDTWEVWFIKNGYLFETTVPKVLGPWLSDILVTWKFI